MSWTREDAAHLLRRTTFGATPDTIEDYYLAGQDTAIRALLETPPDGGWNPSNPLALPADTDDKAALRYNYFYKLASSRQALLAKLLWFWHDHFAVALESAGATLMTTELRSWRQLALAPFASFLKFMYKDGAMLLYLDGDKNIVGKPNENFARETLELHTVGAGVYSETDVREAARAFTGWRVSDDKVSFSASLHDAGSKTVLGQSGNFDGDAVMALLAARGETRDLICAKLYRYYIGEPAEPEALAPLTSAWDSSGGNIKSVLTALLHSPPFWDPANRYTLLSAPLDFAIGLIRSLGLTISPALATAVVDTLTLMGHNFLNPPNPAGYPQGVDITGASHLLARYRLAWRLVTEFDPTGVASRASSGLAASLSPDALIDAMAARLSMTPSSTSRSAIKSWLGAADIAPASSPDKLRGVLYLLACAPEYQLI